MSLRKTTVWLIDLFEVLSGKWYDQLRTTLSHPSLPGPGLKDTKLQQRNPDSVNKDNLNPCITYHHTEGNTHLLMDMRLVFVTIKREKVLL